MQATRFGAQKPRETRRRVLIPARMKQGVSWADVCIRNMSSRDLFVQGRSAPRPGSYVEVRRGAHVIVARVIWSTEQEFGAQTQDLLRIDEIIQEPNRTNAPPPSGAGSSQQFERRAVPRAKTTQQAHELSRHLSSVMQFGFLVAVSLSFAGAAVAAVQDVFANPLKVVTASL